MKRSKRYRSNMEDVTKAGVLPIDKAVDALKSLSHAKFDETVEVHIKLNINPKKSEQQVRGSVALPFGTGKTPKVAVFVSADKVKEGQDAKADFIFGVSDIDKIKNGEKIAFDIAVATPDMMPRLAAIAKILGPKGLMPSPKTETVTPNIGKAIEALKKGKANYKSDEGGCIHQAIGKVSFSKENILENFKMLLDAIEKQKPAKLKGKLVKAVTVATTMSPGIKVK